MQMEISLPHNFNPRKYQIKALRALDRGATRVVLIWHRRGGKDKTILNWVIKKAWNEVGVYWYMLPEFSQARRVIWTNIDKNGFRFRDHFPAQIVKRMDNQTMTIELINGSIVQLLGSDDPDKLVGAAPRGIVFSEYALSNPLCFQYLFPILKENNGWLIAVSTPRGKNHLHKLYEHTHKEMLAGSTKHFAQLLTIDDTFNDDGTPLLTLEDIKSEQKVIGFSDDFIQQEYFCSFEGLMEESFYGKVMLEIRQSGNITKVPHNPAYPVEIVFDIGVANATVIIFYQRVGKTVNIIEVYSRYNEGLPHYAAYINGKRDTWNISKIYAPHDMAVREWGSGVNRFKQASDLGLKCVPVAKMSVEDGINAVRSLLPICWIDEEKCELFLDALNQYKRLWDTQHKCYASQPLHDWTSDFADAMRYLAAAVKLGEAKDGSGAARPKAASRIVTRENDRLGWLNS